MCKSYFIGICIFSTLLLKSHTDLRVNKHAIMFLSQNVKSLKCGSCTFIIGENHYYI